MMKTEESKIRSEKLLKRVAKYNPLKYKKIQSMIIAEHIENASGIEDLQELKNLQGVYFYVLYVI